MKEEEVEMRQAFDPFTLTIELSHTHSELLTLPSSVLTLSPSPSFLSCPFKRLEVVSSEISPMNSHSVTVSVPSINRNTQRLVEEKMEEKEELVNVADAYSGRVRRAGRECVWVMEVMVVVVSVSVVSAVV